MIGEKAVKTIILLYGFFHYMTNASLLYVNHAALFHPKY